jgi:predicted phage replisome organizer
MADVKWIKIVPDIFDDEKILLIESLPDAYAIITVWFKLLCLAGKQNNNGVFIMSERIPYTDKMLATIFRMNELTVSLALRTFEEFHMIEIIDGVITIPNWNKYQTLDSYEKRKERDRIYQAERRAAQRALIRKSADSSTDASTDSSSDVGFSDKEEDKEEEKEIDNSNNSYCAASSLFQSEFGELTPIISETIGHFVQHHGEELTIEAMKVAISAGNKNLSYVQGILRNWKNKNLKTVEEVRNDQKSYSKKKTSQNTKKTDSRRYVRNERDFRGQQDTASIFDDLCVNIEKDEPKKKPSEKEVEEFAKQLKSDYPDFSDARFESAVESFRNGTWE